MSTESTPEVAPVKGQHIFRATVVEPMAVRWKQLAAQQRHDEAQELLVEIIHECTSMFLRLAQYEGFHHTVELESLVSAAQSRVPNWLVYWDPAKGKLFSWLSTCAKHVFLGEVARATQHRNRFHATGENMEKFVGAEDHAVVRHEASEAVRAMLQDLTCRWNDPQILCCLRYHLECVVENPRGNKKHVIRGGAYAGGVSPELSKFLYHWAIFALRDAMYDRLAMPYTEQDLFRLQHSFTYLPDLLNVITWQQMLKIIALLGGTRIRVPTMAQLEKFKTEHSIFSEVGRSLGDPDSAAAIARKYRTSVASAEEAFERLARESERGDQSGDYSVYGED